MSAIRRSRYAGIIYGWSQNCCVSKKVSKQRRWEMCVKRGGTTALERVFPLERSSQTCYACVLCLKWVDEVLVIDQETSLLLLPFVFVEQLRGSSGHETRAALLPPINQKSPFLSSLKQFLEIKIYRTNSTAIFRLKVSSPSNTRHLCGRSTLDSYP